MGHIQLSRSADLVVVAPATADLMAKMANGLANDLASTTLLATDKKVLMAPAMNVRMWESAVGQTQPRRPWKRTACCSSVPMTAKWPAANSGPAAWPSRWRLWPPSNRRWRSKARLAGVQGAGDRRPHARAGGSGALPGQSFQRQAGLCHRRGPGARRRANHFDLRAGQPRRRPHGVKLQRVTTAREMLAACEAALPADVLVMAAAVADWRPDIAANSKIKKSTDRVVPLIKLVENPDILATLAPKRAAAAAGDRLCRRDRRCGAERRRQARRAKARTGSSPMMCQAM